MRIVIKDGKTKNPYQLWRMTGGNWQKICTLESRRHAVSGNEIILPVDVRP
jgi:hypothetical protein